MTPKEKADKLIESFLMVEFWETKVYRIQPSEAKQCALICVNELIKCLPSIDGRPPNYQDKNERCMEYWVDVQSELEKL